MADVPLGRADYHRSVPKEARITTRNRYFEQNPVLTEKQTALISRPGMRRWTYVGNGPIRGIYSQPGSFNDALFVVSDTEWWIVDKDGTKTMIQNGLLPGESVVSMAGTGTIGDTPEYMFLADGRNLFVYTLDGFAKGAVSGTPADTDGVRVGDIYYEFTTGSVDAGTPAGTLADPWLIDLGTDPAVAWQNLGQAFDASGEEGVQYSTGVEANPDIIVMAISSGVSIRAAAMGADGNSVITTETGAAIEWTAATLTGGGEPGVSVVKTPDDVGVVSLGYLASYIIAVPAQGEGINGRFWWIEPGETTIDPLNFATAERAPDPIFDVVVFGDQFWLPGSNTTEVWYFTGIADGPVLRLQGVTFDRGTWQGTALQVKESMIIVDSDGGVFQIAGGLKRISNPSIEERIRQAIQTAASTP